MNTGNHDTGGSNWKSKRLDLPTFSRGNPDGWIFKAECFFSFYNLTKE